MHAKVDPLVFSSPTTVPQIMVSTEIHVPISVTQQFSIMSCLLVRSLAQRAQFPGDWRVVFTVSRDTDQDLDSPLFAWAADYPVEFRWVDEAPWNAYGYIGTGVQGWRYDVTADVLLLMDADMVVVRPLTDLVLSTARSEALGAVPAWQPPPDVDLVEALTRRGLTVPDHGVTYLGYGLAFMSPKSCPPYFNMGFVALRPALAKRIGNTLFDDVEFAVTNYRSHYGAQVALCLNIVRNGLAYQALDPRYNCGNGDLGPQRFSGPDADAAYAHAVTTIANHCVLHYCAPGTEFQKRRDMASWEALHDFCLREVTGDGAFRVKNAIAGLL